MHKQMTTGVALKDASTALSTVFTLVMSPVSFLSSFSTDHQSLFSKIPALPAVVIVFLAGMAFQGMHQRVRTQRNAADPQLPIVWLRGKHATFQHMTA